VPMGGRPEHIQKIYDYIPMGNLYTCNVRNKKCPWGTPGTRPEDYNCIPMGKLYT